MPQTTEFKLGVDGVAAFEFSDGTTKTVDLANVSGGGGGSTNLTLTQTATDVTVVSDTGTDATIPAATSSNAGVMSAAQVTALAGKQSAIPSGTSKLLAAPATNGADPVQITLGTNLSLSGTTLNATGSGGSSGAGQLTAVTMSTPVNVAASNTKSTSFKVTAGTLGKNGVIRVFGIIEKTGATEAALAVMKIGAVGQAFSAMTTNIGQVNNTGAAGVYSFDVMIAGNGVDTTTVVGITPFLGFQSSSSAKVSHSVDTSTTDFEIAIGGNPGATTAQWKVLNAQCYIVNPDASPSSGGSSGVLAWQTVTPNPDGTTAVAIDASLGINVTLNAPVNGTQVINVPSNLPDGAEMQINLVGGGGSGFWTAWSSATPSTAGWYFPDGLAPLATATNSEIIPIYVKRRGVKYVALLGTAEVA
jgi:hypothetical protein